MSDGRKKRNISRCSVLFHTSLQLWAVSARTDTHTHTQTYSLTDSCSLSSVYWSVISSYNETKANPGNKCFWVLVKHGYGWLCLLGLPCGGPSCQYTEKSSHSDISRSSGKIPKFIQSSKPDSGYGKVEYALHFAWTTCVLDISL